MPARKEIIEIGLKRYKECTKCRSYLTLDLFHTKGCYKDGSTQYKSFCKECHTKDGLKRYHKKRKETPLYRVKAAYRYTIKAAYGLSEQEYNKIYSNQGGVCLICSKQIKNVFTEVDGALSAVDHCHDSGGVRGILCRMCNSGLGMLEDSETNLKAALKYLGGFNGKTSN